MSEKTKEIGMKAIVGAFAENKEKAKAIRLEKIMPVLEKGGTVTLDFAGVEGATQSFIHALISEILRKHGLQILDRLLFKSCNETVKKIIIIVVDYMQEAYS